MKKILFTTLHPAVYINIVCNKLEKNNHVDVIYKIQLDKEKPWKEVDFHKGIFYKNLGLLNFLKMVKEHDVVILDGWTSVCNIIAMFYCLFIPTKCAVFSDCPSKDSLQHKLPFLFKKYVLFKLIDCIFCTSDSTIDFYLDNYNISTSKTALFPYYYDDINSTKIVDSINEERENKLLYDNEKIHLLIANRFIPRKGYDIFVKALQILQKKNCLDKYKITISGTGPLFDRYKNEILNIDNSIKFLGWIEYNEYLNNMNHCDVYLHFSRHENFGIPPLDALFRTKLLIASNGVQSVNSFLKNKTNGFIYEAEDYETLAHILMDLKKSDIYKIARIGKQDVMEKYNNQLYDIAINSLYN